MGKGICTHCGKHRWLRQTMCLHCLHPVDECVKCGRKKKIYVDGLCYLCYQDRQVGPKLERLSSEFKPVSEYNGYLFTLYLTYLRRYRLKYSNLPEVIRLKAYLELQALSPFKSWPDVYEYSRIYTSTPAKISQTRGCPLIKIGLMLQELGVLPPKVEDRWWQLQRHIAHFDVQEQKWLRPFLFMLEETRRSPNSISHCLIVIKKFNRWIKKTTPQAGLLVATEQSVRQYLDYLFTHGDNIKYLDTARNYLNLFYKWARQEKLILLNPCDKIKVSRTAPRLCVCAPEQIKKLINFIKVPQSPAEQAMLLALILFFGLRIEDLAHAQLNVSTDKLSLTLRRKPLTRGRRYYNREQVLTLPTKPAWFLNLQKRFYANWLAHYQKVAKTYPHHLLLLPNHNQYNRPLRRDSVTTRVKLASLAATGVPIPARVLRQTCGHLHSRNEDASVLSCLGWSPHFSFEYTWRPRHYYSPKISKITSGKST